MKSKVKEVIKFEFLRVVKTKGYIISLILAPLIIGGIMAATIYFADKSTEPAEEVSIGILDNSHNEQMSEVIALIKGNGWKIAENSDVAKLREMVFTREIKGYMEFNDEKGYCYYSDNIADLNVTNTLNFFVQSLNRNKDIMRLGLNSEDVSKILHPESLNTFKLSDTSEPEAEPEAADAGFEMMQKSIVAIVVFFLIYMSIIMFGQSTGLSVVEDKSTKIVDVLLTSVRPSQLLLGKVIGIGATCLLQIVVWVLMASIAKNSVDSPMLSGLSEWLTPSLMIYILFFFLFGVMTVMAICAAFGSMSETQQHYQQLAQWVIWLAVVPMASMTFLMKEPDSTFSVVLSMIPIISSMVMPFRMLFGELSFWEPLVSLLILVITFFFVIKLAGKVFRNGIMNQGKEFGFKDIAKWLKQ